jgi:hypothetical protein
LAPLTVLPAIAAAAAAAAAIATATTPAAAATTTTTAATTAAAAAATTAATAATTAPAIATATAAATSAAAAIATATAAATSAAAAAAATATLTLLRFVHAKGSAVEHRAVHFGDRLLSLGVVAHGDESESARFAGLAIGGDVDVADFTKGREGCANGVRRRVERQIANVETITHVLRSIHSRLEENQNPAVQSAAVGSGRGRG